MNSNLFMYKSRVTFSKWFPNKYKPKKDLVKAANYGNRELFSLGSIRKQIDKYRVTFFHTLS